MRVLIPYLVVLSLCLPAVAPAQVVIDEIHYEPLDETLLEEFLELYNAGETAVDLSGWYFSDGISYTFPESTSLGAKEYLVVAEKPEAIAAKAPGARVLGPFQGHLSNDGERIVLRNSAGRKEDEVDYQVRFPWPLASAGDGSSMELLNPSLDNDLGGSWRASGPPTSLPEARVFFLRAQDPEWHYRKGESEASDPISAWRELDFTEDSTWHVGQTNIGYGDPDNITLLDDMSGKYSTVYLRRQFFIPGPGVPNWLILRLYVDDGAIVWINGYRLGGYHVGTGEKPFNGTALFHEAKWEEILISNTASYLNVGANMLAIHALNQAMGSNDFSIDAELCIPARSELPPSPTPGTASSVLTANAPPQIRQVEHTTYARSGNPVTITAKVTDPDGVASVSVTYQIVLPGGYIPARLALEPTDLMARPTAILPTNPAFEAPMNWSSAPMADDGKAPDEAAGDGIFTGTIPPQGNRTLVRWRISAADAAGNSVTVPYPDDESLNFACFVYDGIPPYVASKASVHPEGKGHAYPPSVLESLPVYFLITRAEEVARCIAYNGAWQIPKGNEAARDAFNWEGAFVYEGIVYDHIHYRLRQANDRYGGVGKRSWKIRFNRGHHFQAHDNYGRPYPTRWRTLNTGKMFDNLSVGNFGLTESLNEILWNMVGVPAPFAHTFHFRVVDGVNEAPADVNGQYYGDFWGMALAIEDYEPHFLEAHNLPDGNLYKLKDGIFDGNQLKRNQGRYSVTTDADFQNIRANLRPERNSDWLNTYVNYDRWYPYHAVVEGIRHYDFVPADSHSKNRAWFFEPDPGSPYGRLWTLPWDADASWGPNWNSGIDYSMNAIYGGFGKPEFKLPYRNVLREFRDLVWQEAVIKTMIDDLAAVIAEFSPADRDRWRLAPSDAGSQDFGTMEAKVLDMKNFAFVGWTGSTGPTVPAGGRARHLDDLANAEGDSTAIPRTPTVTYVGPAGFPIDGLVFETTPFSDPQGDGTFGAMKWRMGEVTDTAAPDYDPFLPKLYEYTAVWESEELADFSERATIPLGKARPGHLYRVRVRMMDNTGRWSHWSAPVQFTAGEPEGPIPQVQSLRVTEIMYNPFASGDLEFIEILNTGAEALDLSDVRFAGGITFAFEGSGASSLGPGEYAVVVKNLEVFSSYYDTGRMKVAGEYGGRLSDDGDQIRLVYRETLMIQEFIYDDAWYPDTDGLGHSLVIVDPSGPPDLWTGAAGWRPSVSPDGSPGGPDGDQPPAGGQVPGDIDQNTALELTDIIAFLGYMYLSDPAVLPCGDGTLEDGANRALLDSSGDGLVDLSDAVHVLEFLYLAGSPPFLGTACTPIAGCPSVCNPSSK